jgi:phage regulator Rha-like protein
VSNIMNELMNVNVLTMSSDEIANLVELRPDNVKRTIETLIERGIISKPQIEDGKRGANGVIPKIYLVNKRDSFVVVAQLSPEFTGRVVDRWLELEAKQKPLSQLEILVQSAQALVDIEKRTTNIEEQVKQLQSKSETSPIDYYTVAGYATLLGIKVDVSRAKMLGHQATRLSKEHEYFIGKAHSSVFGSVNTYHVDILTMMDWDI